MNRKFFLFLFFCSIVFVSCTKDRADIVEESIEVAGRGCVGCDVPIYDPGDGGGGSNPGGGSGSFYTGGSSCAGGTYTVTHSNQFKYSLAYSINNGVMTVSNFTTGFMFPGPGVGNLSYSGSVVFHNVSYNDATKKVTITVAYQVLTKAWITGPYGNPSWEIVQTENYTFTDYINTCDGQFIMG